MPSNPVREATPLEAPHKSARALNIEQVTEWLDTVDADAVAARRDLPDLCRFMLATGVRVGEALGVSWPDVDLDTGWVAIEHTVIRIKGRGLVLSRLMSESSYRTLVLAPWAVEMLRDRRRRRAAIVGPVFPSSRGTLRDPSNTLRDLREVRRQDESLAWVTSHTFRKTLATLLDGAGESARVVADQLGHSRISMTQDHYMGRRAVAPAAAKVMQQFAPAAPEAGSE